jgi:hypothetical protein
VFENRMLRRIFGLKMEEVAGLWRRLHNEDLYSPYDSQNNIFFNWLLQSLRTLAFLNGLLDPQTFGRAP